MPLDILSDPVERAKGLALAFVDGPDTFLCFLQLLHFAQFLSNVCVSA